MPVSVSSWIFFAATETLLCLTPGPAVLFVLSSGLARGSRSSLWASGGILAGNTFYFVLTALGLGTILLASHQVFLGIKYVGAAYLVYLGLKTMWSADPAVGATSVGETDGASSAEQDFVRYGEPRRSTDQRDRVRRRADWRTMTRGFALQVANPKALMFFAALLPQFINPKSAIGPQVAILGVTSVVIEFLVLAAYGRLAARAAVVARQPRFVTLTNRISGGMLIAAGAGIALTSDR